MPNFIYVNNVSTTLAQPVSDTATVIQLSSTTNAPTSIPAGYVWEVTLNDEATQQNFEILYATAYLGNGQYQVLRGQEGTAALAFLAGDYAFGAVTAGMLGQFVQQGQLTGYVQLSPGSAQSGFINVSGNITGGGTLFGNAVQATGGISGNSGAIATSLSVGSQVSLTQTYSNRAISALALQMVGSANVVGVGPSSGLSAQGITASTLAIAQAGSAKVFAFDINGNLGLMGGLYGASASLTGALNAGGAGTFGGTLAAPTIKQNGLQVIDSVVNVDGSIHVAISNGVVTLSNAGGGTSEVPIGGVLDPAYGTGGAASIALPSYGSWLVELVWSFSQATGDNNNRTFTLALTSGSPSGAINQSGTSADNATFYGTAWYIARFGNSETVEWSLETGAPSISAVWIVKAIRTA